MTPASPLASGLLQFTSILAQIRANTSVGKRPFCDVRSTSGTTTLTVPDGAASTVTFPRQPHGPASTEASLPPASPTQTRLTHCMPANFPVHPVCSVHCSALVSSRNEHAAAAQQTSEANAPQNNLGTTRFTACRKVY